MVTKQVKLNLTKAQARILLRTLNENSLKFSSSLSKSRLIKEILKVFPDLVEVIEATWEIEWLIERRIEYRIIKNPKTKELEAKLKASYDISEAIQAEMRRVRDEIKRSFSKKDLDSFKKDAITRLRTAGRDWNRGVYEWLTEIESAENKGGENETKENQGTIV